MDRKFSMPWRICLRFVDIENTLRHWRFFENITQNVGHSKIVVVLKHFPVYILSGFLSGMVTYVYLTCFLYTYTLIMREKHIQNIRIMRVERTCHTKSDRLTNKELTSIFHEHIYIYGNDKLTMQSICFLHICR